MEDTNATETPTDNTNGGEHVEVENAPIGIEQTETEPVTNTEPAEENAEQEPVKEGAPEEYADFKVKDGFMLNDTSKSMVTELGKELGLSQPQAQKLVDKYMAASEITENARLEDLNAQFTRDQASWKESKQKDWGNDYGKNELIIEKALKTFFADPEAQKYLFGELEEGASHPEIHPSFSNILLSIGKSISEDSMETGQRSTNQNKGLKGKFADLNQQYKT